MPETVLYVLVGIVIVWLVIIFWMIARMSGNVRIHEMADESLEKHLKASTEWLAHYEASPDPAPEKVEQARQQRERAGALRAEIESRRHRQA